MTEDHRQIRDYISIVSIFVKEYDSIANALLLMKKHNAQSLIVVKENLSICGKISKNAISLFLEGNNYTKSAKQTTVAKLMHNENQPVVLYPGTSIFQAKSIMKCLKVNKLPVADSPLNKKIIGFLKQKDILPNAL